MAVTRASIRVQFPEFVSASDALIDAKIAEAVIRCDPGTYGTLYIDLAVSYLTAHLLALSPFGRTAKLVSSDGSTEYGKIYETMKTAAAIGPRVC